MWYFFWTFQLLIKQNQEDLKSKSSLTQMNFLGWQFLCPSIHWYQEVLKPFPRYFGLYNFAILLLHAPSNIFSHNFEPLSSVMGFWVHERRRHWSGTKIDWLHSTCLAWYLKKYQWSVEVFSFTHRSSIQFVWFTRTNLVKLSRPNSVSNCFHQVPQLHNQLFQIFTLISHSIRNSKSFI